MQGQRGTIGSLPETLEFDCGSTSSTATVDQHIFWNNMRNPAENQYILSPGDINPSYMNSINHEWQNMSGWSLGEPSSSNTQNKVNNNELKRELGLSSSISSGAIAGPRLEERRFEPNNTFSLDNVTTSPMYMRSSNSHMVSQNLNLNAGLADSGSDINYHVEHPNLHKSSGPVNEHVPPAVGSGTFLLPSGSKGCFIEGTDGRPGCSLDTRRVSCKRKAIERNVGQSSDGGSSSYSQHTNGSTWNTLPTQDYAWNNFNRSAPAEQVNARLGLSMGDGASKSLPESNVAGSSESFHRNFRLRINPSSQQISVPPTAISSGSVIRNSDVSSSSPILQQFHPVDNAPDLRSVPPVDTMIPQAQEPFVIHVPALPRNMQSFRWSGGSSSTNSHSSNPVICGDRDNLPIEETGLRIMPRNILEHPVFVPATNLRNVPRNPARVSSSANLSIPGTVGSSLRTGSNAAINPSSASAGVSWPNPQQYPRRLSEYVRRSLFAPGLEAAGSSSNNYSSLHVPSTSSESRGLSSRVNPGSSSWYERPSDSEFGIPYSLRSLAVAGEGSSRLVSEV
ncbi:probable E3 ubiquitin-protein ligase RHG1A isoform X2 [Abrus precatorius]|uniref:Probable E3 ubiquitin-protein ligase RHG1A isoform X2 n=1 Tax=Abrus precatorius TaxID=3816 RepID=A0A8B8JHE6_ABRPR|nr:probable E3 ubiquitin-protein ligase RHG1A isoform X2 [Abrus precatorius]